MKDSDDGPVIWFALADAQWSLGRLEDRVRDAAIRNIDEGSSLDRWRASRVPHTPAAPPMPDPGRWVGQPPTALSVLPSRRQRAAHWLPRLNSLTTATRLPRINGYPAASVPSTISSIAPMPWTAANALSRNENLESLQHR